MPYPDVYFRSVFATERGGGNLTPVFTGCEDLGTAERHAISRKLGCSETVFIDDILGAPQVYFYTPSIQVPSCAHGTLAAASVLFEARLGVMGPQTVSTEAGSIELKYLPYGRRSYAFSQNAPDFLATPAPDDLIALTGLALRCREWTCGTIVSDPRISRRLLLDCGKEMHLTSIAPDFSLLSDVLKERDLTGVFAYARIDSSLINARFFAPAIGIEEDPCNGNSSLALGFHMLRRSSGKHSDLASKEWIIRQGQSECRLSLDNMGSEDNRSQTSLRLSGEVLPARVPTTAMDVLNWLP